MFRISGLDVLMSNDGDYSLTVDLPNIATINGEQGLIQQSVEWTIDTTPPEILSFSEITEGGFDEQHLTGMEIMFSEAVNGFNLASIELWKDNSQQPLSQLHIDSLSNNRRELSQFRLLTYYSGNYTLKVNMATVYDRAGIAGDSIVEYQWRVDRLPPAKVENLRISPDLGYSDTDGITSTRELTVSMNVIDPGVKIELYKNDFGTLTFLADSSNVMPGELSIPLTIPSPGNVLLEVHSIDENNNFSVTQLPIVIDEFAIQLSFLEVPEEPVTSNPELIKLLFSDGILGSSLDLTSVKLNLNGNALNKEGIAIQIISDTLFILSGFNTLGAQAGDYTLSIDLTKIQKRISGRRGTYSAKATWTILNTNVAPVANAGEDFDMLPGEQYWLDASGSSDPDKDQLTYEWFPPAGITLDDPYSANPSFIALEMPGTIEYTFILSVSDGYLTSTDKVNAYLITVSEGKDRYKGRIMVYPNPSNGYFTVAAYDTPVVSVRLIDFAGKVLMHRNWTGEWEQTFQMEGVPAGVYFVQIYTSDDVVMRRIIVL